MRFLFFALLIFSYNLATAEHPISMHSFSFKYEAYSISVLMNVGPEGAWLDAVAMTVDPRVPMRNLIHDGVPIDVASTRSSNSLIFNDIEFVQGFSESHHPLLGPSYIIDFKDNSFVVVSQDFEQARFSSPFHSGSIPVILETNSLKNQMEYYLLRTSHFLFHPDLVWPLGALKPAPRRMFFDTCWKALSGRSQLAR